MQPLRMQPLRMRPLNIAVCGPDTSEFEKNMKIDA